MTPQLPVAVIGAGPVGLAAAAHLIGRGLDVLIFERDDEVAASQRAWGHVRLFSPWRYSIDRAAAELLRPTGWTPPPAEEMPTGRDLVERYLQPLAALPVIRERLHLGRRVEAVTRLGMDKVRTQGRGDRPFSIRTRTTAGVQEEWMAAAVLDASGTWFMPNPLGSSGLPALNEDTFRDRIAYGIPDILGADRERYTNRSTMVVGAGHSAANSILALVSLAETHPRTEIAWVTRGSNLARVFGGGAADGLPARGALGAALRTLVDAKRITMVDDFRIASLHEDAGQLEVRGERRGASMTLGGIDSIIASTGQRPDLAMLRELRLGIDPALESVAALAPLIDPNQHSCGTVRPHGARELAHPEEGFFVVGSKSYGRAPTFLLATGYEQARSVVAMLAGDQESALRIELDLPETGVCNSRPSATDTATCCA
jgi:thioredoxin reductase